MTIITLLELFDDTTPIQPMHARRGSSDETHALASANSSMHFDNGGDSLLHLLVSSTKRGYILT